MDNGLSQKSYNNDAEAFANETRRYTDKPEETGELSITPDELTTETIAVLTDEERDAEIRAKYPRVYRVDVDLDDINKQFTYYFKHPSTLSFNRVVKTMTKQTLDTMRAFTMESIIKEQMETYTEDLKKYPGLAMTVGNKLLTLLGMTDSATLKKL